MALNIVFECFLFFCLNCFKIAIKVACKENAWHFSSIILAQFMPAACPQLRTYITLRFHQLGQWPTQPGDKWKTTSSGQSQITDEMWSCAKNPLVPSSKIQGDVFVHLNNLGVSLQMKQKLRFNSIL